MLVTGWPVALPIAGLAIVGLPRLLRQTSNSAAITRIEAIATWTEMLQGTLTASAGLGQAIMATAPVAPLPIRPATVRLSARLEAGAQPREALLQFADELADPSADRVVCALLLATAARAQRLGDLLTALADSTRDEVALRLRIETSRASVRSGVRTVLVFSVSFAVGLAVLARPYLAPFGTAQGQLVLVRRRCPLRSGPDTDGLGWPDHLRRSDCWVPRWWPGDRRDRDRRAGRTGCPRCRPWESTASDQPRGPGGRARPAGADRTSPEAPARWRPERLGTEVVSRFERTVVVDHPRWASVLSCLAGDRGLDRAAGHEDGDGRCGRADGSPGAVGARLVRRTVRSLGVAVAAGVVAAPLCAGAPLVGLLARARERRRHFRCVVGSFVDLVVLSLAGGVGIEGALLAASQVSSDWAAGRMHRVFLRARDSGESPWGALGRLGQELGVPELVELSSSLQLAGTEGTRIRQSLSARAVSLRRHEQAEAESAANATTERLFLPGALLLLGFLLFVGYPAVNRILGGG